MIHNVVRFDNGVNSIQFGCDAGWYFVSFSTPRFIEREDRVTWRNCSFYSMFGQVSIGRVDLSFYSHLFVSCLGLQGVDRFNFIFVDGSVDSKDLNIRVIPFNCDVKTRYTYVELSMDCLLECCYLAEKGCFIYDDVPFYFKETLFIFKGLSWADICKGFFDRLNIRVSGGLTTRRHHTSPLVFRHVSFLLCIFRFRVKDLLSWLLYDGIAKRCIQPIEDLSSKNDKRLKIYKPSDGSKRCSAEVSLKGGYEGDCNFITPGRNIIECLPPTDENLKCFPRSDYRHSMMNVRREIKDYGNKDSHKRSYHHYTRQLQFANNNSDCRYVSSWLANKEILEGEQYLQLFSPCYTAIKDILNSDLDEHNKQKIIEEKLREFWKIELYNLIRKQGLGLNKFGIRVVVQQLKQLDMDIREYLNTRAFVKYKAHLAMLKVVEPSLILSVVMGKVIPFVVKYEGCDKQPVTKLFRKTGEALLWEVGLQRYKNAIQCGEIEVNPDYKVKQYMEDNNIKLSDDELITSGCDFIIFFCDRSNFVEVREIVINKEERRRVLFAKSDLTNLLENITYLDTEVLPMIVKPKAWRIDKQGKIIEYGGCLTNNEQEIKCLVKESIKNPLGKSIRYKKDLISAINKMASVEYVINKEVLDIISSKVYFKENGDKLIYFKPHIDSGLLSRYNNEKNYVKVYEITSHNSKHFYDISILNIAHLMCGCDKLYFTNFIDWRGRIYTSCCTLNMQGGEVARGLLLFKKGEVVTEKGLYSLKIYLANAFGLDKKSKTDRINWVNKHMEEIIETPDNDLWLKAEEPIIFLACALEIKGYNKNPQEFISRLPILLDATCNGLQHLSAMAGDVRLAQRVNISRSTADDDPRDIYSELLSGIQDKVKQLANDKAEHYNLGKLNIVRKLVKRGIMTITYGVTPYGILEQLLSEHFFKCGLKNNHYVYRARDISLGDIGLSYKDLFKLSEIIYNVLFESHPVLNEIMQYFNLMIDLLNNLELPIQWITPSGLLLTQRYSKFTSYDVTTAIRGIKPKKITLRKPNVDSQGLIILNKDKQVKAFIPNYIHSFDGSHIILLVKRLVKVYDMDIITIHDCFGVGANHAELLAEIVKECFIAMYVDRKCIEKFHNHILTTIKLHYIVEGNKNVIDKEGNTWTIPVKPSTGKLIIEKVLPFSANFLK